MKVFRKEKNQTYLAALCILILTAIHLGLCNPTPAFADAVVSIRPMGVCGNAWRKLSRTTYRQSRDVENGSLCRVRVYLHDSVSRRPLRFQQVQVFGNLGSGSTLENSCYDPVSQVFTTDRFGKADVFFPWDTSACSVAIKPLSEHLGTDAVRFDLTRFVSSAHREACQRGSNSNTPTRLCQDSSIQGNYVIQDAVLEEPNPECQGLYPSLDYRITVLKDGSDYHLTSIVDGFGSVNGKVRFLSHNSIEVVNTFGGLFGKVTSVVTLSQITPRSANFLHRYAFYPSGNSSIPSAYPSQKCIYQYRGASTRR